MNLIPKLCTFFVFMLGFWYLGIFDYVPNYKTWDGYNAILSAKDKAIAFHQWRMATIMGNSGNHHTMPDPNDKSLVICNPATVQPNARLPLDVYHRHQKHRDMSQTPSLFSYNKHTYCTNNDGSQMYLPAWDAAQGLALLVYHDRDKTIESNLANRNLELVSDET